MSTNYYWNTEDEQVLEQLNSLGAWQALLNQPERCTLEEKSHIGLRSGAGLYCYKCSTWFQDPLNDRNGVRRPNANEVKTNSCPHCNKTFDGKTSSEFVDGSQRPKDSIECTCRFFFANWPDEVYRICHQAPDDMPIIVNEYMDCFTGKEFIQMMRNTISITTLSLGHEFS